MSKTSSIITDNNNSNYNNNNNSSSTTIPLKQFNLLNINIFNNYL